MNIAGIFFKMSASVETFGGTGASGDVYSAPVTVRGHLDDASEVTVSATGEATSAPAKFFCALSEQARFTPESRVTVNGRVGHVRKVRVRDADGFGGPSHLEVELR